MGVVELFSSYPSTSLVKSSVDCSHRLGGFSFDKKKWRVNCMASTILVEGIKEEEAQQRLSDVSSIRSHLLKLSPYQPILPFEVLSAHLGRKPEEIVKLDANENPYGPPPEVFEALASNKFPYVYPDPETRTLRAVLSEDSGLESEYILAGCGADELIDLIMRVLDPGDKIVDCPPTFTMYEFDAPVIGGVVIRSKLFQEHLTSPSNPDGSIISDEDLLKILGLPILVVLDEAYIEFSGLESKMQWVKKHENLIVLRTFSKRASLAGLGVGYGAFPLSIIEYLWRAKQPHNVSVAADVSACAALKNGEYLEVGFSTFKPTSSRFRFCRVFSNDPYKNWVKHSIYKKASFKCLCLPSGIEFVPKESKKDEETSVVTVEEETEFSKTWKAFQGLLWKKVSQLDHIPERYERNAQVMFWVVAGSGVALATFFSVFYVAACKNCVENMMNSGKLHPLVCPPTATVEILKKTEKKQLGEIADKKLHERISVRKF